MSLLVQRAVEGGQACTTVPSHGVDQGQCIFQELEHCWGWGGEDGGHMTSGGEDLTGMEEGQSQRAYKENSFGLMILEILKDRRGKIQYIKF